MSLFAQLQSLRQNGRILLDSNLLLLVTIGSFDRSLIQRFKRTEAFTGADYDLLTQLIQVSRSLVTTPQILTEVGNLANALPSHLKLDWSLHFAAQVKVFVEVSDPSRNLTEHPLFAEFGLTDASIARLSQDTLIVTQDGRLAARLNLRSFCAMSLEDITRIRATFLGGN